MSASGYRQTYGEVRQRVRFTPKSRHYWQIIPSHSESGHSMSALPPHLVGSMVRRATRHGGTECRCAGCPPSILSLAGCLPLSQYCTRSSKSSSNTLTTVEARSCNTRMYLMALAPSFTNSMPRFH